VLRLLPRVESERRLTDCLAQSIPIRSGALGNATDLSATAEETADNEDPFAPGAERHGGDNESHDCGPGLTLSSKAKVVKKGGTYAVFLPVQGSKEWVFIGASRSALDAQASSAFQQYECVPSLTMAKLRRKCPKNLLARSRKIHT
jgi:hypothetical protein